MMYFLDGDKPSLTLAHLTQRMSGNISVTDTLPRSAISLVHFGSPLVLVVVPARHSFVVGTVLLVSKVGTARVGTRTLGFARHLDTSFKA